MPDPEAIIRQLREHSNTAIAARDADRVVSYMTPDVRVEVAGGPVLSGRDASHAAFAAQFSHRAFLGYVREPVRIAVNEPPVSATERGQWTGRWSTKSGVHEQRGTYTAEWKFGDMGWLITLEAYRSAE